MRLIAGLFSLGRFFIGIAFIAQPRIMERAWIGKQARVPGAQLLARAVGARDLTVGLGGAQAVARNDGSAGPWLGAAAVCDAVDFAATLAAGRRIPKQARNGVLVVAAVSTVVSALGAVVLSRSGQAQVSEPAPQPEAAASPSAAAAPAAP